LNVKQTREVVITDEPRFHRLSQGTQWHLLEKSCSKRWNWT